ncbi:MAG: hypothetical protein J6R06_00030 [Bacteroidales bacterium]|nr:hypothetical protein [Bacteroidales bacterium]
MKRIIFAICTILCANVLFAQRDATMFLGIPIEGTKSDMIEKLEAFGFSYNSNNGYMEGWFNDEKVWLNLKSQNRKVVEIAVIDKKTRTRNNIINRFNKLVEQFDANKNYSNLFTPDQKINVSFGHMVTDPAGRSATFFQKDKYGLPDQEKRVWVEIKKKDGLYIISEPEYYIVIHYENLNNKSNGSDL